jgi:hypothetical protein
MIVSEIELFEALSEQVGKEKAKVLVQYVENKIEKNLDQKKDVFATKQDLSDLEVRLNRTIYIVGVGQFLAILVSLIGLLKFLH